MATMRQHSVIARLPVAGRRRRRRHHIRTNSTDSWTHSGSHQKNHPLSDGRSNDYSIGNASNERGRTQKTNLGSREGGKRARA